MPRPAPGDFAPFYAKYMDLVTEDDIQSVLSKQLDEFLALMRPVSEETGNMRHPPYTWSVKQVVGHLADSERVFGYRALRFARGDTTPLPGFEENDYARTAESDRVRLADLVSEFEAIRRSHIWLFRNMPAEAWDRDGTANGARVTVRALAFIMAGHVRHHGAILKKRLASEH
jgi:hypothetical protein